MRNNIQNDVKIESATTHVTKKDLSGSVNNTYQIGRVGVLASRLLLADSKSMAAPESLVQTAPLVSPCYAKQFYRQWHMFVPLEDVFKNYSALMTDKEISRNGTLITPTRFPHAPANFISSFVLNGSKCTMWFQQLNKAGISTPVTAGDPTGEFFSGRDMDEYITLDSIAGVSARVLLSGLVDEALPALQWQPDSDGVPTFNLGYLNSISPYTLISGNLVEKTFILPSLDEDEAATDEMGYDYNSFSTPESADIVFYKTFTVSVPGGPLGDDMPVRFRCAYCFRLSTWGAELYKVLNGLGYSLDPDDTSDYSILPLIATFKAYWDIFGLNLWQNYESTRAGMLQTYYDNKADCDVSTDANAKPLFYQFMRDELGQMWVTEKNDYISAHLPQPVIGGANETPLFGLADVLEGTGDSGPSRVISVFQRDYPEDGQPDIALKDGHARISKIQHGYLDSEILKRMYKATNTQTQFGQLIVAQMRTQGLGTYLERTRTNFIGDFKVSLDVSGVTATSDTYQSATKDGRPLGSRAGKCVGYGKKNKKLWYKTDCVGWWIALDAITADSGWAQGVDLTNKVTRREEMYQPLYDGAGLKINNADVLVGRKDICLIDFELPDASRSPAAHPWGYMTRFAEFKVGRNTENGGFALKSRRNYFLTYDMNKLIFLDNLLAFDVKDKSTETLKYLRVARGVSLDDLPIAGNPYRFLARYPWLSNLGRIFANVGRSLPSFMLAGGALEFLRKAWEYVFLNDDNYIVQTDLWFKTWNASIPIEDTYGTIDPEEKDNLYMEKV